MSVPILILGLIALVVLILINRELRIVRRAQRASLPTNHPDYRPEWRE